MTDEKRIEEIRVYAESLPETWWASNVRNATEIIAVLRAYATKATNGGDR